MIVAIDTDHAVRLEEPLDFKRFHVAIAAPPGALPALRDAFAAFGAIENEMHAWIDADALRQWPGLAANAEYQSGLRGMLDYAARKGWMSADGKRVRAHIVWAEAATPR
jgi:hypothetical protein